MTIKYLDPKLNPHELVIIQVLHDNPGAEIPDAVLENFSFRNLKSRTPLDGEIPQRNTTIEIDLLAAPSEIDGDWVEFAYHRFALTELFSDVILNAKNNVKGWEVEVDENGIVTDGFEEYVSAKFGIRVLENDPNYVISKEPYKVTLTASNINPSFTGAVTFNLVKGLKHRVAKNNMGGFDIPYTAPSVVGDIIINHKVLSEGTALQGNLQIISQFPYDLVFNLKRQYPEPMTVELDRQQITDLKPPGDDTPTTYYFKFTIEEIVAAFGGGEFDVLDYYNLEVNVSNEVGANVETNDFTITSDVSKHITTEYIQTSAVDNDHAKGTFKVITNRDIDVRVSGADDVVGNVLINGMEKHPNDLVQLNKGVEYLFDAKFLRTGNDELVTININGFDTQNPGNSYDPTYGVKTFGKLLSWAEGYYLRVSLAKTYADGMEQMTISPVFDSNYSLRPIYKWTVKNNKGQITNYSSATINLPADNTDYEVELEVKATDPDVVVRVATTNEIMRDVATFPRFEVTRLTRYKTGGTTSQPNYKAIATIRFNNYCPIKDVKYWSTKSGATVNFGGSPKLDRTYEIATDSVRDNNTGGRILVTAINGAEAEINTHNS